MSIDTQGPPIDDIINGSDVYTDGLGQTEADNNQDDSEPARPGESHITKIDRIIYRRYKTRNVHQVKTLNELMKCGLPGGGETAHIVTNGKHINAIAFIQAILQKEHAEHLDIVTYSIRKKTITMILDWFQGDELGTARVNISCHVRTLNPDCYAFMRAIAKEVPDLFRLKVFHNHAKLACVKTEHNHYVLEGSGNFSENALVEQYQLTNSKELYDFHMAWIDTQKEEYDK